MLPGKPGMMSPFAPIPMPPRMDPMPPIMPVPLAYKGRLTVTPSPPQPGLPGLPTSVCEVCKGTKSLDQFYTEVTCPEHPTPVCYRCIQTRGIELCPQCRREYSGNEAMCIPAYIKSLGALQ